ncbi:ribosome silencing factor [Kaustia mangrovi]|uniref:ribosome silencing factor n=1 Tax=Kaustia mangrovi TaxID=2593653 RepID=UPI001FE96979|nr:ribosome silencing factor [Kaustia mangrovi]
MPVGKPSPSLLNAVLACLEDAKAEDVVSINLTDKTPIADQMVIASGRSQRHVGAIADQLLDAVKQAGYRDIRVEGLPSCDWVLIDSGDVVVHVFRPEVRSFYNLEKLWSADAPLENVAV